MPIDRLRLEQILSFIDTTVELGPLNVLIGPNASGKSNLIEVISLLRAAPNGIEGQILQGGGVRQWLWLGDRTGAKRRTPGAHIQCELRLPVAPEARAQVYRLEFGEVDGGFEIGHERLSQKAEPGSKDQYFTREPKGVRFGPQVSELTKGMAATAISPKESVFARVKIPGDPTPITAVGQFFERIGIYREFRTGPRSQARSGVSAEARRDFLSDGADNLVMVLSELDFLGLNDRIGDYLKRFCERFEGFKVRLGEGLARPYLRESGLTEMLSGLRMSDGTLKFLCLLAILFHPNPAPLICIEEPELGLHPDAMRLVAEVLVEASERTQLVITTHSEALVDALTDRPESVLVCERDFDNGTQFKRLSSGDLDAWLEHYTLGELWRKGEIGGGRW